MSSRLGLVTGIARPSGESLDRLFEALEGPWASLSVSKALLRKGRFLVTSQLTNWFGCKGYNATVTSGIASGLEGLAAAVDQLQHSSAVDAIVVVSADEVSQSGLRMFESLGRLARGEQTMNVYSEEDTGSILGEGAIALVLERHADAVARNAPCYGLIDAISSSFDSPPLPARDNAHAWLESDESGHWLAQSIRDVIERADMSSDDIDIVFGNGLGNTRYDMREQRAVRNALGRDITIHTVNSSVGLLESSCGLLNLAASFTQIGQRSVSPTTIEKQLASAAIADSRAGLVVASSETGRNTAVVVSQV